MTLTTYRSAWAERLVGLAAKTLGRLDLDAVNWATHMIEHPELFPAHPVMQLCKLMHVELRAMVEFVAPHA